jgi:hypothetical protein
MRSLLLAVPFAAAFAVAAPVSAQALPGVGLEAVAGADAAALIEEARSRRTRVVKRNRRPYYVPYACSRPYKYYYWQFWPPVCYPL